MQQLTEPLEVPAWLTRSPSDPASSAPAALRALVERGRNQNRLITALTLLRLEARAQRGKAVVELGGQTIALPTKRQVDSALAAVKQAEKKVRVTVAEPFEKIQEILRFSFSRPGRGIGRIFDSGPPALKGAEIPLEYDDLFLPLTELDEVLARVRIAVEHVTLLMTRHTLRDELKAYLVAYAYDFENNRYCDKEVADLITAAIQDVRDPNKQYTDDALKEWRNDHKELIEKAKRTAAYELSLAGYVVEEKDGQIVRVTPPRDGDT